MHLMTEGKAKFYASKDEKGKISRELEVFYNPLMKFNRDVSILLLNDSGLKNIQLAEIMAGSGVRSIRFLLELKKGIVKKIFVNDFDEHFTKNFKKNLSANRLKVGKKIVICNDDANKMLLNFNGFDYIDIDPFGSPNPFLNSSIVRLSRGGIIGITATDTAPLSGANYATCVRSYWARPLHAGIMHETGLRILIRKVQMIGAQHDKALIPIYSYFKDYYFRIFFRCIKGKLEVDKLTRQHKYVLYCTKCMATKISIYNHLICDDCNELMEYCGPMWVGRLFDYSLAEKMSRSNKDKSIAKFLEIIANESKLDNLGVVGFYNIHEICKHYKLDIPNFETLIPKIEEKGYKVSRTHFTPIGIRSDVMMKELVGIIRECR